MLPVCKKKANKWLPSTSAKANRALYMHVFYLFAVGVEAMAGYGFVWPCRQQVLLQGHVIGY